MKSGGRRSSSPKNASCLALAVALAAGTGPSFEIGRANSDAVKYISNVID